MVGFELMERLAKLREESLVHTLFDLVRRGASATTAEGMDDALVVFHLPPDSPVVTRRRSARLGVANFHDVGGAARAGCDPCRVDAVHHAVATHGLVFLSVAPVGHRDQARW